jgi:hypothetical protein
MFHAEPDPFGRRVGERTYVHLIGVVREGPKMGPDMVMQCAQFEPVAWWWARHEIGSDLRKRYEVPKDMPPKLLALVSKIDAVEGNYLSRYAPPVEPRSVGPSGVWFLCT